MLGARSLILAVLAKVDIIYIIRRFTIVGDGWGKRL